MNEANQKQNLRLKTGRNVPNFHISHPETDMTQPSQRVRF